MLGVLGINHKTASLGIRDKFAIPADDIIPLSERFLQIKEIAGVVVLATCNRTEVYYSKDNCSAKECKDNILNELHSYLNVETDYSSNFYHHTNADAIRHLFRVTSGIDSMVIGENQIVNQMKKAYVFCTEANLTDAILMRLFQKSFECSKKVRTETSIQQGATSVGYVAIDMCEKIFENLKLQHILIVGTGETGQLALRDFKKRGVADISITNRTDEKTLEVAKNRNVNPILFRNFKDHLAQSDIILTATSAGEYLITKQDIEQIQEIRKNKKQLFIDLSVPRNIDIEIGNLDHTQLICVDDLQKILDDHKEMRENSVDNANIIIDELVEESITWLNSRSLRPVIKSITTNMQQLSDNELIEYRKNMDEKTIEQIEKYTGLLTQKYIRMLIKNLKEVTNNGNATASLDVINQLFNFEDKINE
ncbi:glutamyl-tRNA reductase [Plebeiibacterium sediminum]|uniref:Glutamyl-tRNA reductase n=1 Tax=Plebeiibacterium sediminum TaxID=2992112 RepID=A0AAE3M1S6_9BACT|nr:glutamyl-tRNA reductase [Plebeiobacterium sediminum]MCW3785361.1 glutamyl-tRNA reductase [Plebeiobacterium sediminum]